MNDTTSRTYRAFMSYSHRDEASCVKLHKRLDAYQTPREYWGQQGPNGPIPKRLYPIFRDRDELAASANLPQRIIDALSRSDSLVVLCSPGAVNSRWVHEEIHSFVRLRGAAHIYPVIVDGEPPACFPAALCELVAEPLAADLRNDKDGFDDGSLKVAAGILGLPFAALKDREAARARRRARINMALAATFAVLALIASFSAYWANAQLNRAERAIAIAVEGASRKLQREPG